jgi:hypothetical protein
MKSKLFFLTWESLFKLQPEVLIAESWFTVKTQTFDEFNQKTQKDQALQVIRLRDSSMAIDPVAFLELFQRKYAGKKYDHHFLWDNYDENGDEMLYCSEFVGKFLTEYFGIDFPIKQMHFSRNLEAWKKHFRGEVPVGKWGNSPGDFERSPLFIHVQ